jgi:hypothetical protein
MIEKFRLTCRRNSRPVRYRGCGARVGPTGFTNAVKSVVANSPNQRPGQVRLRRWNP